MPSVAAGVEGSAEVFPVRGHACRLNYRPLYARSGNLRHCRRCVRGTIPLHANITWPAVVQDDAILTGNGMLQYTLNSDIYTLFG